MLCNNKYLFVCKFKFWGLAILNISYISGLNCMHNKNNQLVCSFELNLVVKCKNESISHDAIAKFSFKIKEKKSGAYFVFFL